MGKSAAKKCIISFSLSLGAILVVLIISFTENANAAEPFPRNLYFGLRNDTDVSRLQEFLRDRGYFTHPNITGNFFSVTREAVKKFQSANGILATGYFGPLSRGAANNAMAVADRGLVSPAGPAAVAPPVQPPIAPAPPPSCTSVWCGTVNIGGTLYNGALYKIPSALGIRPSGIKEALALDIQPQNPSGSAVVLIAGGKNGGTDSSFVGSPISVMIDLRDALNLGAHVVFAEYRGSINPGGPDFGHPPAPNDTSVFNPPLPSYGSIIPGYDTYDGSEWGHGEVEDVVSVINFVKNGGVGQVTPGKLFISGGSHGGYLALAAAHRVDGIRRVVSAHGGADAKKHTSWIRNTPSVPYGGRSASDNPRDILESATAWSLDAEKVAGFSWPTAREANIQRIFRQAGGETEFMNNKPGCSLYATPPLSTDILLISDINDWLASAEISRSYFRHWANLYPNIKLWERNILAEGELFDPNIFHGHKENLVILKYLLDGTAPPSGPIAAALTAQLVDSQNGTPFANVAVEISELFDGCGSAGNWKVSGITDANGTIRLNNIPAGFSRATVSQAGRIIYALDFYVNSGSNNFGTVKISTKFAAKDRIQTNANLNVRAAPTISATLLGTQPTGALGTVINGPTFANGLWWWNINYDAGADGWSVEGFFQKVLAIAPAPTLSSVSPTSVTANQAVTFTVTGSNFQSGAVVKYFTGSSNQTATIVKELVFDSSVQLRAIFPLGIGAGTWVFYIENPDGKTSGNLSVVASAAQAGSASVLGITSSQATISWTGSGSANSSYACVWPTASGSFATANCYGTKGGNQAGTSGSNTFTNLQPNTAYSYRVNGTSCPVPGGTGCGYDYLIASGSFTTLPSALSAPVLSSVFPSSVTANQAVTFTITGANFQSGVTAYYYSGALMKVTDSAVGGTPISLLFDSSTQVRAVFPNGIAAGTWVFYVRNPDGKTSSGTLTVTATISSVVLPAPVLSSVSPSSVTAGQSVTFTISGANFQSGAVIVYSGPTSGTFTPTFISSTQLRVDSATLSQGTYTFYVKNPDGKTSGNLSVVATAASVVVPAPTLVSVSPASVTANQAVTFTITGANFQSGAVAKYFTGSAGLIATVVLQFDSSTQLRAVFPSGIVAGSYAFYIENPDGKVSGLLNVTGQ